MIVKKNTIIEVSTYIGIASSIWILSPTLGKCIDSFHFHYRHILADSVSILFAGACVEKTFWRPV